MCAIERVVVTAGSICVLGSAMAAELTGDEINELIAGKTLYLELTAASSAATPGKGVLFFASDGNVLYKLPKGRMWHGTWAIKQNTVCSAFKEFPNTPCTKYDKRGDSIALFNAATGQLRAWLLKIAPGNAENLTP
jgi:hypothetical protein